MATIAKNTKKNVVKVTTTKVVNAKKVTKVKVTYLAEGVTGKQFQSAILDANKNHKADQTSFSYCLRRAVEFEGGALKLIKGFDMKDLTPKNLIPLRAESRKESTRFSVYEIYNLIRKYYKTK